MEHSAKNDTISEKRSILAIGAHPDDVEIGCGGTLAKHIARGDTVTILTLSLGANGGDTRQRMLESQRAAELVGAKLILGDLSDAHIDDGVATISLIQTAIQSLRPHRVYTHSLHDTHQDHRAVHRATLVAARGVPDIFSYQSPSTGVEFSPNHFSDISAFIEKKLALIAVYESQTTHRANLKGDLIHATARYWGRFAGYILAEPLCIIRQCD